MLPNVVYLVNKDYQFWRPLQLSRLTYLFSILEMV